MYGVKSENLEGREHLGNLDVDEKIILKWILRKYSVGIGLYSSS
jgi:hypothetical protein